MGRNWTGIGLGLGGAPLLRRGCHISKRPKEATGQAEAVDGKTSEAEETTLSNLDKQDTDEQASE